MTDTNPRKIFILFSEKSHLYHQRCFDRKMKNNFSVKYYTIFITICSKLNDHLRLGIVFKFEQSRAKSITPSCVSWSCSPPIVDWVNILFFPIVILDMQSVAYSLYLTISSSTTFLFFLLPLPVLQSANVRWLVIYVCLYCIAE